jgi:DNA glycosylase AlkZ-like
VKPEDVSKIRMGRMGLIDAGFQRPLDVVEAHLAMQAQDYDSAKWSIGQRLTEAVDADVERVVSKGIILRTHVLRPTWHFVARRDLRWVMALSGPRLQRGLEPRYRQLELDVKTRSRAEKLISKQLQGGNHLVRRDLGEVLRKSHIEPNGQRLAHLLMHCELEAVVCSGRVRGKAHTYALFDERVPRGRTFNRDQAVVELVQRYLMSHGPATLKDMSWWSGLTTTDLRSGLEALSTQVRNESVEGLTLWSMGEERPANQPTPVVQLLQAYDEFVVGYTESRYLGDPRAARVRSAFIDRNLRNSTVMLDDRVAGHWRRSTTPSKVEVDVELYAALKGAARMALGRTVDELSRFIGRRVQLSTSVL